MASSNVSDHHSSGYYSQPRGFLTPPPTWKTNRGSPAVPWSEKKPTKTPPTPKADLFHVVHKIPSGDSPYVRAKHVQLVDKDPSRAISLFWAAINQGDRVDSALKDMAVVMKQLDRSDEAIEAIKSFRHLSPPESQESLDNILVELYKHSGRIEEEIEMLQLKLKQVEEGLAFCGKRTKTARSQGKKVQITVEKEYSRLLGNLAWAYMQVKAFKSAEEQYRKALSFEADKNKQCNLAVCLMHMNKLTEAKFLLQTVSSGNGYVDESYAKSYERACQILAEFESQEQIENKMELGIASGFADGHLNKLKPFGGQWDSRLPSQKNSDDDSGVQSSPMPLPLKTNNGALTEFPYEKRADSDWRRIHHEPRTGQEGANSACRRLYESPFCGRNIPKVPFTQPRRCSSFGYQRKGGFTENAYGSYCRKLEFGSSRGSETVQSFVNQTANYYHTAFPSEMPKVMPQFSEKQFPLGGENWRGNSSVKPLESNEEQMNILAYDCKKSATEEGYALPSESAFSAACEKTEEISDRNLGQCCKLTSEMSTCEHKRSWADMVEEDEDKFCVGFMNQEGINDENVDSNIITETPKSHNQAEKLSLKIGLIDLGSGYFTQPEKTSMNQSVRRSLCFNQDQNPDIPKDHCTSPLTTKVLNFEGQGLSLSEDSSSSNGRNRRRLQVFQDITHVAGSPRPC